MYRVGGRYISWKVFDGDENRIVAIDISREHKAQNTYRGTQILHRKQIRINIITVE